jgi:hypothetical protein
MKPWKSSSLPVQATPTKLTVSANLWAASSTEGASRLQVLQVGAQNQNAVGLPATDAPSNVPPPTSGAVNSSASGTGDVAAGLSVAGAGPAGPGVVVAGGATVVVADAATSSVDPAPVSSAEQAPIRAAVAISTGST